MSVYAELLSIAARERKSKSWARTFFPTNQVSRPSARATEPELEEFDLEPTPPEVPIPA
ncbi:MAG: hypothetical protein H0U74_13080 [Bradymonadaceae bacterium]|nr:hypothetical protein [Lujinxingiaceae bacterium]